MDSQLLEFSTSPGCAYSLQVYQGGSGPDLLYLHGAGGLLENDPFLDQLSKTFRVTAPLLPGYGDSEGMDHLRDMLDFTLHTFDVWTNLSLENPLVVGHSMGGLLAARFVQRWPNRAAGAAFLGAVIGDWKWARKVLSLPQLPPEDSDPMGMSRDLDVCRAYAADPLVYRGLYKRPLLEAEVVALDKFREEIHEIRIPVGFFHGTADPFVPYGDSLQAINDMPSAAKTIKLYAEAKHELVNEINKEEVIGDLQGWIDNTLSNQTEGTR